MEIIKDFVPRGRRNRPGLTLQGPEFITIHDTANSDKGADALAHASYIKGDAAASIPASWHFTVDDKRAVQHLPTNEVAWHAGDGYNGPGNRSSLAIEICQNADGDRAQAEANAAALTADLCQQSGLGLDAIRQHHKWSGKNCPRLLLPKWDAWLRLVEQYGWDDSDVSDQGIVLQINSKTYWIDGQAHETDMPPQIIDGRTVVPVRLVAEALGKRVDWDAETRRVSIK